MKENIYDILGNKNGKERKTTGILRINDFYTIYKLNVDKIETFEDLKKVLKNLNIEFTSKDAVNGIEEYIDIITRQG